MSNKILLFPSSFVVQQNPPTKKTYQADIRRLHQIRGANCLNHLEELQTLKAYPSSHNHGNGVRGVSPIWVFFHLVGDFPLNHEDMGERVFLPGTSFFLHQNWSLAATGLGGASMISSSVSASQWWVLLTWVVPLPSNSHHQDYDIFSRGSL